MRPYHDSNDCQHGHPEHTSRARAFLDLSELLRFRQSVCQRSPLVAILTVITVVWTVSVLHWLTIGSKENEEKASTR